MKRVLIEHLSNTQKTKIKADLRFPRCYSATAAKEDIFCGYKIYDGKYLLVPPLYPLPKGVAYHHSIAFPMVVKKCVSEDGDIQRGGSKEQKTFYEEFAKQSSGTENPHYKRHGRINCNVCYQKESGASPHVERDTLFYGFGYFVDHFLNDFEHHNAATKIYFVSDFLHTDLKEQQRYREHCRRGKYCVVFLRNEEATRSSAGDDAGAIFFSHDPRTTELSFYSNFLNLVDCPIKVGFQAFSGSKDHDCDKKRQEYVDYCVGGDGDDDGKEERSGNTVVLTNDYFFFKSFNVVSNSYAVYKKYLSAFCAKAIRNDLNMEKFQYFMPSASRYGNNSGGGSQKFKIYTEDEVYFYTPRFYGLRYFGKRIYDDFRFDNDADELMADDVTFGGILKDTERKPQQRVHDMVIDKFRVSSSFGGIISLYCGCGKTVTAIAIAVTLHLKTVVVVTTVELLEQWVERIRFFAPNARVGIMQQDRQDTKDKDFVVAMVHSLSSRTRNYDVESFGLCVVDECHRIACQYFFTAVFKMKSRYILGLSATPTRKDGMNDFLRWTCGPVLFTLEDPNTNVDVQIVNYCNVNYVTQKKFQLRCSDENRKKMLPIFRSKLLTHIADDGPRNAYIADRLFELESVHGRSTLLLTERLDVIRNVVPLLAERYGSDEAMQQKVRIITGESVAVFASVAKNNNKKRKRDTATAEEEEEEKKRIVLASYQKAKEGLDLPYLDTLLLATPSSDVVQAVGRILREHPTKKKPLVVDIADRLEIFDGSKNKRLSYYKKKNYQTVFIDSLH